MAHSVLGGNILILAMNVHENHTVNTYPCIVPTYTLTRPNVSRPSISRIERTRSFSSTAAFSVNMKVPRLYARLDKDGNDRCEMTCVAGHLLIRRRIPIVTVDASSWCHVRRLSLSALLCDWSRWTDVDPRSH